MDVRKLVGRNVRRLRVARHISQEDLAVDAEVGRAYVSGLERGTKNATIVVLERVAQALSAPVSDLFTVPKPGEAAPKPLPGGRRRGR